MAQGLPVFPHLSVDKRTVDTRWTKWCKRFDSLLIGMDINDDKRKRDLLLSCVGEEVNDMFDTFPDTNNNYQTAVNKLTEYFAPKKSTEFEIYIFRQAK